MRLHVTKPSDFEDIRQPSRTALRFKLRQLKLTVHLNDNNREQWRLELRAFPATFPKLEYIEICDHMRPTDQSPESLRRRLHRRPSGTIPEDLSTSDPVCLYRRRRNVLHGRAGHNLLPRRFGSTCACDEGIDG